MNEETNITITIAQADLESQIDAELPRGKEIDWSALMDAASDDAESAAIEAFVAAVQEAVEQGLSAYEDDKDDCPDWLVAKTPKAKKTKAA